MIYIYIYIYMRLKCPRNSLDIITEEIVAKTVITIDYLSARPKRQWIIIYNGGGGGFLPF